MTLLELFQSEGSEIVEALKESLDRNGVNASGRLRASIEAEATEDRLIVSAAGYALSAEDGRGPSKKGSNPGILKNQIENWLEAKGIPVWSGFTRKSQAYVIARKIHKSGTKLFREGGNSGVLSSVINDRLIDEISARALDRDWETRKPVISL